jgi:hypothetical protein
MWRKQGTCKLPVLTGRTGRGGSVTDRDRAAHPQAQHLAGAAAIDRDLGEPVRVDVPEGFARPHRRESGGWRDRPVARDKPRAGWDLCPPQPGQRIAVMVDIDDLGEIVGPAALGGSVGRRPGHRRDGFPQRQPRRDRGEQVAAVETRRQGWRAPGDLRQASGVGAPRHNIEETVIRPDIKPPIGLDDDRAARAANPRIDDTEKDRAGRKPRGISGEQVGGGLGLPGRRVGRTAITCPV